jgi:hypothetical protein
MAFQEYLRILARKVQIVEYNLHTREPWLEIFNSLAAIVGRTLPSPLPIRRSSRNAGTRLRNGASLAVRLKRTTKGVAEGEVTVRLQHRERQ